MAAAAVSYYPSELETQQFWKGQASRVQTNRSVPEGFPKRLTSPLAWAGAEIESKESEWKLDLTEKEVQDIDNALVAFEAQYEDLSCLSSSTFCLPEDFSKRLRKLSDQLYKGVGFQIIHGIDPTRYTPKQKAIIYAGISSHVCPERGFVDVFAQDVISHITNVQAGNSGPKTIAPAFSNTPLSFHTDNCEIMAFFYYDTAFEGGRTVLSSSHRTYNDLASTRPEVLHTLAEEWVLDSFKSNEVQPPRHVRPLQNIDSDKVDILFRFSRYPITGWQRKRNPDVPLPSQAQREAADAVQFTAMKNSITLPCGKGDMLFVNDMAVFHAREGFDDHGVPRKRHLAKMYLRDPEQGWGIPVDKENQWGKTYGPNRPDGTRVEGWQLGPDDPDKDEKTKVNG